MPKLSKTAQEAQDNPEESKMADLSRREAELAEAYAKLKARTKSQSETAARRNEELIRDALTVGSGWLLGRMMGQKEAEAETDKDWEAADEEKKDEIVAEYQGVGGFPMDLLVGGAAAAAGLMKLGGKMSDTVRAVGIGALTEWAGRTGYDAGYESEKEEAKEED